MTPKMSASLSYLYSNQSCTVEEVFPTVGHICPLSLSLRLLPPDITHRTGKTRIQINHKWIKHLKVSYPRYVLYMVRWSELANARAALARLASSFLFIGVEKGDFSVMAAAMVA